MENLKLQECLIAEDEDKFHLQDYQGMRSKRSVQDFLHISDEVLDQYYEASRELLESKRYEEAADAYTFMTFINPLYASFWLGLGIAEQSQEHYTEAAIAYTKAIENNPYDPASFANMAQCLVSLNEREGARICCDKALEVCDNKPEYHSIKEQVESLKKNI